MIERYILKIGNIDSGETIIIESSVTHDGSRERKFPIPFGRRVSIHEAEIIDIFTIEDQEQKVIITGSTTFPEGLYNKIVKDIARGFWSN